MSFPTSCPAGPSRPSRALPTANSMAGRISLLADVALKDSQPLPSPTDPTREVNTSRVIVSQSPPRRYKKRRFSTRVPQRPSSPPPHLPPSYLPYDAPSGMAPTSMEDPYHIIPPSLPTLHPTPMWHSSSQLDFVLPTWIGSTSESTYAWPTSEMDEKLISRPRLPRHQISSQHRPPPGPPEHYPGGPHSPQRDHFPPFRPIVPPPLRSLYTPPVRHTRRATEPSPPPLLTSDAFDWDFESEELVSVTTKKAVPRRRDMGKRRQQNADAQKRFRSKKKRIQEQVATELEDARNQTRARDEIIDRLRKENAELRKFHDLFSGAVAMASPSNS